MMQNVFCIWKWHILKPLLVAFEAFSFSDKQTAFQALKVSPEATTWLSAEEEFENIYFK